jgi:hypothetical protein
MANDQSIIEGNFATIHSISTIIDTGYSPLFLTIILLSADSIIKNL